MGEWGVKVGILVMFVDDVEMEVTFDTWWGEPVVGEGWVYHVISKIPEVIVL